MRKKLAKKSKVRPSKQVRTKVETLPTSTIATPQEAPVSRASVVISAPDPRVLYYEAEQEPNYRELSDYFPVIDKLREKGFSYREIADWLSERGVDADFNAVYRVYTKNLSDQEAAMEAELEENDARG